VASTYQIDCPGSDGVVVEVVTVVEFVGVELEPFVGADLEIKLATLCGTGAPADDEATAPPKETPPAAAMSVIASPPVMMWNNASSTAAAMMSAVITM
jgi:hypothetical protein